MMNRKLHGPCRKEISECLACDTPDCASDMHYTDRPEIWVKPYLIEGTKTTPFEADDSSFLNLCAIAGVYLQSLEVQLKENHLNLSRWRILVLLGDGCTRSITYLASKSAGKNSATTRIVQRLERDGFVNVSSSKKDTRFKDVKLTKQGECARLLCFQLANQIMQQALDNISTKEFQTFSVIAEKMRLNLKRVKN